MSFLARIAAAHDLIFLATASVICLLTAWLSTTLIALGRDSERGKARFGWMVLVALVAGIGVWTTHFVAMLGFRPDLGIRYDLTLTILSCLASIAAVGLPLALAVVLTNPSPRLALGLATGAGVGVMHLSGMAAIEGCTVSSAPATIALAFAFGTSLFTLALRPGAKDSRLSAVLLFTLAVVALHFTAVDAVTALPVAAAASERGISPAGLGIAITGATLALFLCAGLAVRFRRKMQARDLLASQAMAEQAHRLGLALDNISSGLVMFGRDRRILLANRQAAVTIGLTEEDLAPGTPWQDLTERQFRHHRVGAEDRAAMLTRIHGWIASGEEDRYETSIFGDRTISIRFNPIRGGGAVVTYDDVTRERRGEAHVLHLRHHDILTGLPNRAALKDHLDTLLPHRMAVSLIKLDLDRFQDVNDGLGHAAADLLLVGVAERLLDTVGRNAFCARTGGDEMAVAVADLSPQDETDLAERIRQRMCQPFAIENGSLEISATLGIARFEALDGEPMGHEELMRRAALTLARAKQESRGTVRHFHPSLLADSANRRRMRNDLTEALRQGHLTVAFQPLTSIETGRILGFEALVRWTHPTCGPISPAEFIPLAEESGLIGEIGAFVLDEACRAASTWPKDVHVAVNVSPIQLQAQEILAQIVSALARHDLTPDRLEIELTETAIVENGEHIAERLAAIRTLGVKVAMDDFGTGYSSLAHLRNFSLDRIKIDRSFVATAATDKGCLAVLKAVTQMGRDLGVLTIGEGVENEEQFAILKALGCDIAQGWLLGRPMPAADAERLVAPGTAAEAVA